MGLFPKAFRKMKVAETPPVPKPAIVVEPQKTERNPGNLFNLVRIVEEHGPQRIKQIDAEIAKLHDKQMQLKAERDKVEALVNALNLTKSHI